MDRALKVDLKKKVRGIKPIENNAACKTDKKSQLILQYCKAIRFALQDDGCYPLEAWRFEALSQAQEDSAVTSNLTTKFIQTSDLEKLLRKLSIVDELKPQYRRIKRLYTLIFEANAYT